MSPKKVESPNSNSQPSPLRLHTRQSATKNRNDDRVVAEFEADMLEHAIQLSLRSVRKEKKAAAYAAQGAHAPINDSAEEPKREIMESCESPKPMEMSINESESIPAKNDSNNGESNSPQNDNKRKEPCQKSPEPPQKKKTDQPDTETSTNKVLKNVSSSDDNSPSKKIDDNCGSAKIVEDKAEVAIKEPCSPEKMKDDKHVTPEKVEKVVPEVKADEIGEHVCDKMGDVKNHINEETPKPIDEKKCAEVQENETKNSPVKHDCEKSTDSRESDKTNNITDDVKMQDDMPLNEKKISNSEGKKKVSVGANRPKRTTRKTVNYQLLGEGHQFEIDDTGKKAVAEEAKSEKKDDRKRRSSGTESPNKKKRVSNGSSVGCVNPQEITKSAEEFVWGWLASKELNVITWRRIRRAMKVFKIECTPEEAMRMIQVYQTDGSDTMDRNAFHQAFENTNLKIDENGKVIS